MCDFLHEFERLIHRLEPEPDGPLHADFHRRFDAFLLANQLHKTAMDEAQATLNAKRQAASAEDVSQSGLHPCALPSCGCTEHSHREFRWCDRCQKVKYCSEEHRKADKARHRDLCKAAAARLAAAKEAKKQRREQR